METIYINVMPTEHCTVTGNVFFDDKYIKAEEQVIKMNFIMRKHTMKCKRIMIIKDWVNTDPLVLSIGSGGYEPLICGATYACDISFTAEKYLRELKWVGTFAKACCTNLPYPNQAFSKAYCTEVIEHLPTLDDVVKSFEEIDRVARDWIVTTPSRLRGCKNTDPDHKRDFTLEDLRACITPKGYKIYNDREHFFIVKERGDDNATTFRQIFNRHNR